MAYPAGNPKNDMEGNRIFLNIFRLSILNLNEYSKILFVAIILYMLMETGRNKVIKSIGIIPISKNILVRITKLSINFPRLVIKTAR